MKSDFKERKENRQNRYEELANKNQKRSNDSFDSANKLGSMIPMGQPILVGHHSEKGHRNHIKKMDSAMRTSIEASGKAQYYADKLSAIENNNAIFSDDPEAIQKLKTKIKDLEIAQEKMKACNKIVKAKNLSQEEKLLQLMKDINISERDAQAVLEPDFASRIGFPSYALTNNNANIKRNKTRLAQLVKQESEETTEITINEVLIIDNKEDNRVQLIFPDKPNDEIRTDLKSRGFRWSRNTGAWQRHCSNVAMREAKRIAESYS